MGAREHLRFVFDIDVHDADGFEALVAEMVAISNDEPGTLIYDWYLDRDTNRAKLYEVYDSLGSLIAHLKGPVFSDVAPRMIGIATFVHVDAYGDFPSKFMAAPPMAPTTWWGPAFAAVDQPDG